MTGTVPLVRRNLLRQRLRLALSLGGIGLSLLLVMSLNAIYDGVLRQVTAYPDHAGASVIVSQRGVETMHMAMSSIPGSIVTRIRRDPEVARAAPILYSTVVLGRTRPAAVYLVGYRGAGGPWEMAAGHRPRPGEIVIDEDAADRLGVGIGDHVNALGHSLRISGLARGTASVVTSVAFVDLETFRRAARMRSGASYLLVWPRPGLDATAVARRLQRRYPVTAQTRQQFSNAERSIVSNMSTGLIHGMIVIGFIVGLAVAALSMYTATTSRLREYAVLKAIGMQNTRLYGMVLRQALMTIGGGLIAGLALLAVLTVVIPAASPTVTMVVTPDSVLRVAVVTAAIAAVAALLPAVGVARVDPASVYRR